MRYRLAKKQAERVEHAHLEREEARPPTFEADRAHNAERAQEYLQAICRRMRKVRRMGFNWLLARAKALNVAVNDATAFCTILRGFEVNPSLKLAALRHAYHGDWHLDHGTSDNGVRVVEICQELRHTEVERAYCGTICLKDSLVDEPVDWAEEIARLDIQGEVEREAEGLVRAEISRQFCL
jgi:hypothetical protein